MLSSNQVCLNIWLELLCSRCFNIVPPPPPHKTFGCFLQNITTIKLLQPKRSPTFRTSYKCHPHIQNFPTSSDNLNFCTNIYRNSLISLSNKICGGQTALSISVISKHCFSFFHIPTVCLDIIKLLFIHQLMH